jgi:hypothetical protein
MNTQQKAESLVNQLIGESDLLNAVIRGDPFDERGLDFLNKLASLMSNGVDDLVNNHPEIEKLKAPYFLKDDFSLLRSILEEIVIEASSSSNPRRIERMMAEFIGARMALARKAHKTLGNHDAIGILASDVLDANEGLQSLQLLGPQ